MAVHFIVNTAPDPGNPWTETKGPTNWSIDEGEDWDPVEERYEAYNEDVGAWKLVLNPQPGNDVADSWYPSKVRVQVMTVGGNWVKSISIGTTGGAGPTGAGGLQNQYTDGPGIPTWFEFECWGDPGDKDDLFLDISELDVRSENYNIGEWDEDGNLFYVTGIEFYGSAGTWETVLDNTEWAAFAGSWDGSGWDSESGGPVVQQVILGATPSTFTDFRPLIYEPTWTQSGAGDFAVDLIDSDFNVIAGESFPGGADKYGSGDKLRITFDSLDILGTTVLNENSETFTITNMRFFVPGPIPS